MHSSTRTEWTSSSFWRTSMGLWLVILTAFWFNLFYWATVMLQPYIHGG